MVAFPRHWRRWQVLTDGVLRATWNFLCWKRKRKLQSRRQQQHSVDMETVPSAEDAAVTLTRSLDGLGSVQGRPAEAFVVALCHTCRKKEEENS